MASVASRMRLRRSRWASEPSSESVSTATFVTWRPRVRLVPVDPEPAPVAAAPLVSDPVESDPRPGLVPVDDDIRRKAPSSRAPGENDTHDDELFSPSWSREHRCVQLAWHRLDCHPLALLEHVLVRSAAFSSRR